LACSISEHLPHRIIRLMANCRAGIDKLARKD
jgi:hypothetical protein